MAFLSFADGSEALFVGDIVFAMASITRQTARPRFMSDFIVKEDRPAVLDQVRALVDLHEREPNLNFVVSHDGAQIEGYMSDGWMQSSMWKIYHGAENRPDHGTANLTGRDG